jgi:glutamate 5-kinase
MQQELKIVVRIEISTLLDSNGMLNHKKMDKLTRVLSNLHNSGKKLLLVSSGAIVLGTHKLGMTQQPDIYTDMQAVAAIGQAELIKFYQQHFMEYNHIVAQVLITQDITESLERVQNTRTTFDTLLSMNIIPIINENDAVSTSDIELDDNYPLALKVAKIVDADLILIKIDTNGKFMIVPRKKRKSVIVEDEKKLIDEVNLMIAEKENKNMEFPASIEEILV